MIAFTNAQVRDGVMTSGEFPRNRLQGGES